MEASPERGVVLAQLSDVHLPLPGPVPLSSLWNKRALSLLSWQRKRRHLHRPEVLAALLADLRAEAPDLVAVTGDLTNLGLEAEYRAARRWLERLGDPDRVMVIPGNHDALLPGDWARGAGHWRPYWQGEERTGADPEAGFPWLRRRGGLALVGVSSAVASAPGRAVGAVGAAQLERLAALLARARAEGLCRVVMVHHPPLAGTVRARKRLLDGPALCAVLAREGAELVLHGHSHRSHVAELPTEAGPLPVIGVPSSSAMHPEPAAYHLYRIARAPDGWRIALRARALGPEGKMAVERCATFEISRSHARGASR